MNAPPGTWIEGEGPPHRVLLLGASGQIGSAVAPLLPPESELHAPGRSEVDVARTDSLRRAVRSFRPDVIVNAAGYTAVDRAESEPEAAAAVNAVGPRVLAEEAARIGALLIHYSTDYVFDGEKREPYTEKDAPGPVNVYGRTKLEGERAVAAAGGRYVVIRSSWVYYTRGANFLLTMLKLFREREEVRVVNDQQGAPTSASFVAEATARVLEAMPGPEKSGVYHLTAAGHTTWYGFASRILELVRGDPSIRCRRVVPIPTGEYPTAARRPAYSVLDSARFCSTFGFTLRPWEGLLQETISQLAPRGQV